MYNSIKSMAKKGLVGLTIAGNLYSAPSSFLEIRTEVSLYNFILKKKKSDPNSLSTILNCKSKTRIDNKPQLGGEPYWISKEMLINFAACKDPIIFFHEFDNKGNLEKVSYFSDLELRREKHFNFRIEDNAVKVRRIPGLEKILSVKNDKVREMSIEGRPLKFEINYDGHRIREINLNENGIVTKYRFNLKQKKYDPYKDGI